MSQDYDFTDKRFYEAKFPSTDDVVMVAVTSVEDMAVYVELLEYNNAPGMILLSELSKKRIRSIQKLVRVGKHEVVVVMRTDEKGNVDLSKRRVVPEEITLCEERYSKSKAVQTIVRHVAEEVGVSVLELNEKVTWPLARKYPHEHDGFREAAIEPSVFDGLDVDQKVKDLLLTSIRLRLAPPPVKIRARMAVSCLGSEGIEGVKRVLIAARDLPFVDESNQGITCEVDIRLIATPSFLVSATATSKELGLAHVQKVLDTAKALIEATSDGKFAVEEEPHVQGVEEQAEDEDGEEEETSEEESSDEEDQGMGVVEEEDM